MMVGVRGCRVGMMDGAEIEMKLDRVGLLSG